MIKLILVASILMAAGARSGQCGQTAVSAGQPAQSLDLTGRPLPSIPPVTSAATVEQKAAAAGRGDSPGNPGSDALHALPAPEITSVPARGPGN